jgi:hypothetical protein
MKRYRFWLLPSSGVRAAVTGGPMQKSGDNRRRRRLGLKTVWKVVVLAVALFSASSPPSADASTPVGPNGYLYGVSCVGANYCEAVGTHTTSRGGLGDMAEVWNGTVWTLQSVPKPAGAEHPKLQSVSCAAVNSCMAIGRSSLGALAEVWNGSAWSPAPPLPRPIGAKGIRLDAVSCVAADSCEAVGDYQNSGFQSLPLTEGWDGISWSVQPSAVPMASQGILLTAVSCGTGFCDAVGYYDDVRSNDTVPFAEAWNGTSWSVQPLPAPSGIGVSYPFGLSCVTAGACEATGYSVQPGPSATGLAEVWDGTSWTIQASASEAGAVDGVSCHAQDACEGVGSTPAHATFAESWDGSVWANQATSIPSPSQESGLSSISCSAVDVCEAVGGFLTSNVSETLAEVWNGTAWTIQATPNKG